MKPLYEYLNKSHRWTKEDSQYMSDILDAMYPASGWLVSK
jgi:hypothetical protein